MQASVHGHGPPLGGRGIDGLQVVPQFRLLALEGLRPGEAGDDLSRDAADDAGPRLIGAILWVGGSLVPRVVWEIGGAIRTAQEFPPPQGLGLCVCW